MKTKQVGYMSICILGSLVPILFTACELEKMTPSCVPQPYELQTCLFPLTPELDGDLDSDSVWQEEEIHWETVHANMAQKPADDDNDASYAFACVADQEFMYLGFRIKDDSIIKGESDSCTYIFNDDSIDIAIDQCSKGCKGKYTGDGAQLMIMAENIDDDSQNDILRCEQNDEVRDDITDTLVYARKNEGGWHAEIAIPLKPTTNNPTWWNIEPTAGLIIGFQTGYNDDDDGGDRDHKLIWGLTDRAESEDKSWRDPTYLEKLMFCPVDEMGPDPELDTSGSDPKN